MKNGTCPKCNSQDIRRNEIPMALVGLTTNEGVTMVDSSLSYPVRTYLCRSCGFTEFYNETFEPDTEIGFHPRKGQD